jgi:predicted acyltransferase
MATEQVSRWDALDVLRGLCIVGMLLNMNPGSWERGYDWLTHARWEGGTLIDMVAPGFLFCIGVALPLSLQRRFAKGASRSELLNHVLVRSAVLVVLGFLLNLYPNFDFSHVRVPSVLSRIGLCYGIVATLVVLTTRADEPRVLRIRPVLLGGVALFILISYWLLLFAVPVPGFGAPRFDPVGSWPAVIDRALIGTNHMFAYWPVDGQVVFDPEGILSTYPACFNVLFGVIVGLGFSRWSLRQPALIAVVTGAAMLLIALLLRGVCPIIKNLWTSTFALFSSGFALVTLGVLMPVSNRNGVRQLLFPTRIFGENPLLAYVLCWLIGPLLDIAWLGNEVPVSLRIAGQDWFSRFFEPALASLLFGVCSLLVVFAVLLVCHRKRWILRL